jgi:hypothetical protein
MQRGLLELCLIIAAVIGIHSERIMHSGSVVGKIFPENLASSVIAVRGNDSVKVVANDGHFGMELQPGDWKLIIALKEYNTLTTEKRIKMQEGQHLNLGEIRLTQ